MSHSVGFTIEHDTNILFLSEGPKQCKWIRIARNLELKQKVVMLRGLSAGQKQAVKKKNNAHICKGETHTMH